MMRSKDEDPDLLYVIKILASEEMPGLPPGGGITSKSVWETLPRNVQTLNAKESDLAALVICRRDCIISAYQKHIGVRSQEPMVSQ